MDLGTIGGVIVHCPRGGAGRSVSGIRVSPSATTVPRYILAFVSQQMQPSALIALGFANQFVGIVAAYQFVPESSEERVKAELGSLPECQDGHKPFCGVYLL